MFAYSIDFFLFGQSHTSIQIECSYFASQKNKQKSIDKQNTLQKSYIKWISNETKRSKKHRYKNNNSAGISRLVGFNRILIDI